MIKEKIFQLPYNSRGKLLKSIESLIITTHKKISDIKGIMIEKGPGAFSALRMGIVTANSLSYALSISAIGVQSSKDNLQKVIVRSINQLRTMKQPKLVVPVYGSEPNITKPRKFTI
ncbi:hypothetical protein ACFL0L_02510 [Patescibacteria group bacterium]